MTFSDKIDLVRVLLFDESADLKHVLMNASKISESVDKSNLNKERQNQVLLQLCLLESDFYVQARNFLLMSILTFHDNCTEKSRINAFLSLLYNMTIDEESFCLLKLTLNR